MVSEREEHLLAENLDKATEESDESSSDDDTMGSADV